MELEFKAGQEVWIMKNNQPLATKIRAVRYTETLELSKDAKTGAVTENVNTNTAYGTFADPQKSCSADKIGSSKEELVSKIFGSTNAENGGHE